MLPCHHGNREFCSGTGCSYLFNTNSSLSLLPVQHEQHILIFQTKHDTNLTMKCSFCRSAVNDPFCFTFHPKNHQKSNCDTYTWLLDRKKHESAQHTASPCLKLFTNTTFPASTRHMTRVWSTVLADRSSQISFIHVQHHWESNQRINHLNWSSTVS